MFIGINYVELENKSRDSEITTNAINMKWQTKMEISSKILKILVRGVRVRRDILSDNVTVLSGIRIIDGTERIRGRRTV